MSITSDVASETTGVPSSFFLNAATTLGMGGAAWGFNSRFGEDKAAYKAMWANRIKSHGLLGGGFQNRFVMGARDQLAGVMGFQPNFDPFMKSKYSFLGWRNIQSKAIGAAQTGNWGKGIAGSNIPGSFHGAMKTQSKFGLLGRVGGAAMGMAFIGSSVYSGYKQGGLKGAALSGGKEAVTWAAMGAGEAAFASLTGVSIGGIAMGAAVVGAEIYGGYRLMKHGLNHYRQMRQTEFTQPIVDPFGMGFTMRQRSLMAIQNSAVNGRLALGNEGFLTHTPLLR